MIVSFRDFHRLNLILLMTVIFARYFSYGFLYISNIGNVCSICNHRIARILDFYSTSRFLRISELVRILNSDELSKVGPFCFTLKLTINAH